jgi:hypothetical protein
MSDRVLPANQTNTERPTAITAQVWRFRGRRYLQKRAAYMAAARHALRGQDDPGEVRTRELASRMARGEA